MIDPLFLWAIGAVCCCVAYVAAFGVPTWRQTVIYVFGGLGMVLMIVSALAAFQAMPTTRECSRTPEVSI